MKKLIKKTKNNLGKAAIIAGSFALSSSAFALDEATNTALGAAYTSGETSVGIVTAGMVGLVALVVGISLVVSLLKRN